MKFTTENSEYEVDFRLRAIRRLSSTHAPTPRQGYDEEWKRYVSLTTVFDDDEEGFCFFIDWDGEGHGTLTSPVKELVGDLMYARVPRALIAQKRRGR